MFLKDDLQEMDSLKIKALERDALEKEVVGDLLIIRAEGELDLYFADQLRNFIEQALLKEQVVKLVINLERVSYIDSSGLGVLLGRYKNLVALGGKVALVAPNTMVKKILEISGLFRIMEEYGDEKEAILKMAEGS